MSVFVFFDYEKRCTMNGEERRKSIIDKLKQASQPISASALAAEYSVTRQIIVADIALLRAAGHSISAKNRGYVLDTNTSGLIKRIAVKHGKNEVKEEFGYDGGDDTYRNDQECLQTKEDDTCNCCREQCDDHVQHDRSRSILGMDVRRG